MSELERAKAKLHARAYGIRKPEPDDREVMGGWVIIRGQKRFIPLWTRRKKQRHCVSCSHYSQTNICQHDGSFINRYTEACDNYESRNIKKVKIFYP